jgi:hypothetical protein
MEAATTLVMERYLLQTIGWIGLIHLVVCPAFRAFVYRVLDLVLPNILHKDVLALSADVVNITLIYHEGGETLNVL